MLNTLFSFQNRSGGKAYGWRARYVVNSFQSINQGTSRLSSSSSKKDQPPIITEVFSPSVRSQLPQILGEHWNTIYRIKETNKASCPQLLEVRECHLCEKENKSKLDNLWKLCIFPTGSFHCFRCSEKGRWVKFLEKCGIPHHPPSTIKELSETKSGEQVPVKEEPQTQASPTSSPPLNPENENKSSDAAVPKPITPLLSVLPKESREKSFNLPHQLFYHQCFSNLFPAKKEPARSDLAKKLVKDREIVKQYLHEIRKLNDIVLRKYLVGFTTQSFLNDRNEWIDHLCISFPWIIPQSHLNEAELNWPDLSNNMKGGVDPKTGKERKRITLSEEEILEEKERQKAPLVFENNEVLNYYVRMKYRSLQTKGLQRILPKGGMWGFFGWHTVNLEKHKSIIITEGEYDCMAVSQVIHDPLLTENALFRDVPVVSLPNGCNSLPPELIERLIPFEKIYLWLDYDKSGQDAADKFSRKLGIHRCVIVIPPLDIKNPPKDANDALRQDPNLILRMLSTSKGVSHKRIEALSKFRKSILATMTDQPDGDAGQKSRKLIDEGTKTPSLPALTEKITGFRRGELVILSGPTGSGKTTLLSQLSLDFAQAGKPTLWGSFEVKNQNLVLKMFQQFRRSPVPIQNVPVETLEKIYDDFEALPIDFLNFYDYVSVDEILETMNFSVERDDIQHLIIDNLQFLLTQSLSAEPRESSDSEDFEEQVSLPMAPKKRGKQPVSAFIQERLERQDELLERFRKFASEKNVNVIIVIHPRKEEDDVPLKLSSIGGTAKATQEADLVLILQKLESGKYLEVKKNRYNGKLGRIRLYYDERMNLYSSPLIKNLPSSAPPAALLPSFLTSAKTIKPKRAQFQPKDMSEYDPQQRESEDSSPKPETTVNAEIPSNRGGRKRKMDTVSNEEEDTLKASDDTKEPSVPDSQSSVNHPQTLPIKHAPNRIKDEDSPGFPPEKESKDIEGELNTSKIPSFDEQKSFSRKSVRAETQNPDHPHDSNDRPASSSRPRLSKEENVRTVTMKPSSKDPETGHASNEYLDRKASSDSQSATFENTPNRAKDEDSAPVIVIAQGFPPEEHQKYRRQHQESRDIEGELNMSKIPSFDEQKSFSRKSVRAETQNPDHPHDSNDRPASSSRPRLSKEENVRTVTMKPSKDPETGHASNEYLDKKASSDSQSVTFENTPNRVKADPINPVVVIAQSFPSYRQYESKYQEANNTTVYYSNSQRAKQTNGPSSKKSFPKSRETAVPSRKAGPQDDLDTRHGIDSSLRLSQEANLSIPRKSFPKRPVTIEPSNDLDPDHSLNDHSSRYLESMAKLTIQQDSSSTAKDASIVESPDFSPRPSDEYLNNMGRTSSFLIEDDDAVMKKDEEMKEIVRSHGIGATSKNTEEAAPSMTYKRKYKKRETKEVAIQEKAFKREK